MQEKEADLTSARALSCCQKRHMVVALAAVVVLLVLGVSGAVFWYLENHAQEATKLALAEQDVRQNLKQAQEAHVKLHEELKKPGGVQRLLNQGARWELQIQSARAAWQRAKDRADNAHGNLDPELAELLQKLDADLARDQSDYDLARRLEKIRLDTEDQ